MPAPSPTGPIAKKIVAAARRSRRSRIVDRETLELGRGGLEALRASGPEDLSDMDPGHAAYVLAHNWASDLTQALFDAKDLAKASARVFAAHDEYMPMGPPMSPVTNSFFSTWAVYDTPVGARRETFGSVVLALGRAFGVDPELLTLVEGLAGAYPGLYEPRGSRDGRIVLRELVTGDEPEALSTSGYTGGGGLWLARVLPPPMSGASPVIFTTPYVIETPDLAAWSAYLERTLAKIPGRSDADRYRHLMKRGLTPTYWLEYVFQAFSRSQFDAIFLEGLPDVPESRPHSPNGARLRGRPF